jgi:hypothetical protein
MFQRPFFALRLPVMMTLPCFKSLMSYFVKSATHLSSQSWPIEMREPDLRLSKMWPTLASCDN